MFEEEDVDEDIQYKAANLVCWSPEDRYSMTISEETTQIESRLAELNAQIQQHQNAIRQLQETISNLAQERLRYEGELRVMARWIAEQGNGARKD